MLYVQTLDYHNLDTWLCNVYIINFYRFHLSVENYLFYYINVTFLGCYRCVLEKLYRIRHYLLQTLPYQIIDKRYGNSHDIMLNNMGQCTSFHSVCCKYELIYYTLSSYGQFRIILIF